MKHLLTTIAAVGSLTLSLNTIAQDILLSYNDTLYTVSQSGQVLDQVAIPADGHGRTYAADLDVLGDGSVAVRGGSSGGEIFLYRNGSWAEIVPPQGSAAFGALNSALISAYNDYLFIRVPSTTTAGVRRFKVEGGRVTQTETFSDGYFEPNNYHNPTYGQDGKLYIFENTSRTGTLTRFVHEINPSTMRISRTVVLPNFKPGNGLFDVDASGNIYYSSSASADGRYKEGVTKLSGSGAFMKSVSLSGQKYDLEVHGSTVLITNEVNVYKSDTNLSSMRALLPNSFFNSSIREKYVSFDVPNRSGSSSSGAINCVLNNPTASNGGFGIHNSYVQNTSNSAVSGWSKTIDFGSATPHSIWSYGVTATVSGSKIVLSKSGSIAPGQKISFGVGGNYRGSAPGSLTCK